jgi:putative two-component system response regulator
MMSHTTKGCEILNMLASFQDEEQFRVAYDICRYHHERYDGSGYPDKLKGDQIPLSAQLVSVADVYDALVSDRVYKKAYDKDTAYEMIVTGKCGQFSPKMMACFEKARKAIESLAEIQSNSMMEV